jgi:hypothetical protein
MVRAREIAMAMLLLAASTAAFAADMTQKDAEKLWGKYAVGFFEKPKMGCVCLDGIRNFQLGTIVQPGPNQAACYLPTFNADGSIVSQTTCQGNFVPLTK